MNAISSFEKDKRFALFFQVLERYEELEEIAAILEKELGFSIVRKVDGPDCRVWNTRCKKIEVLLINDDPYGSFLRAETASGIELLKEMMPKLNQIFARFLGGN